MSYDTIPRFGTPVKPTAPAHESNVAAGNGAAAAMPVELPVDAGH